MSGLLPPDITWTADGTPRSRTYDDIYFAPADGPAETRHVFLDGIGAPEAWRNRQDFTVGETGFGTGLNFLCLWDMWRRTADANARLHYISAEAFPLSRGDMAHAHARWPGLASLAQTLVERLPHPVPGFHPLELDDGRVRLTLLYGDAASVLADVVGRVDAWFLDGFAPGRNPDMWSPALFREIARLSATGAELATFTVAGEVRRALTAVGFSVEKAPGFGSKRQCLRARLGDTPQQISDPAPWFTPPAPTSCQSVAVIGGGIAGLMTARALRARGLGVTLFEAGERLAGAASGNPVAIVEPWLDMGRAPGAQLTHAATRYALDWYHAHGQDAFDPCGVLTPALNAKDAARQRAIGESGLFDGADLCLLDKESASQVSGLPLDHGGLFWPRAGMVHTAALARTLAIGIECHTGTHVTRIEGRDGAWALLDPRGHAVATTDAVVCATAFDTARLSGFPLPLRARRGQVTLFPSHPPVDGLECVIGAGGYITPAIADPDGPFHLAGATFDPVDPDGGDWRDLKTADHVRNLRAISDFLPDLPAPDLSKVNGRTGLRATTADHRPVMGGVPDTAHYASAYTELARGTKGSFANARYRQGLYMMTGLGARGYLSAPLLAETLAALITGTPTSLPRAILDAMHPARDLIRRTKRGQASS